uniref:Uncharacterized protein n=1 Tax=viral metagenome TaxID=1070528 RepID=A0A6C0CJW4_9ZZZZ
MNPLELLRQKETEDHETLDKTVVEILQHLLKENAELKEKVKYLEDKAKYLEHKTVLSKN